MNAIDYAITYITRHIPKEILDKTFISTINHRTIIPISTEARIKELVIRNVVMKDIDIIGGTHITVSLDGLPWEQIESNAFVVRIPKNRTEGRSIVSALSVAFGGTMAASMITNPLVDSGNDVMSATQQMLNSLASIPYVSEAQVALIADNVVMIQGFVAPAGGLYLRCEIENDRNLNNIKRRSYLPFAQLCLLACKAYIFTNNVIPMDIGYYEGGASINRYKEIVDSYESAQEEYEEFLTTRWARVSKLNDMEHAERLIRITTGGNY